MTRAALIVLDFEMIDVKIVGLAFPEYQMRRAIAAGALHLAVVVDRVPAVLVQAIDRIRAEGIPVSLVRHASEAADLFHPDEQVLLLSGLAIVGPDVIQDLVDRPRAAVLCLPAARDASFETIDARLRWTGIACVTGALVRATSARGGDWDLGSTLLREALQAKAARIVLPDDASLFRASDTGANARIAQVLSMHERNLAEGAGMAFVALPTGKALVALTRDRLALSARVAPWLAFALFAAAIFASASLPSITAFALLLMGSIVAVFAALANAIAMMSSPLVGWLKAARDAAATVAMAIVVVTPSADHAPVVLAMVLVVVTLLSRQFGPLRPGGDVVAYVAILTVGSLFGTLGVVSALCACAICAFATLAIQQRRALAAS